MDKGAKKLNPEIKEEREGILTELRKQVGNDAEFVKKWVPDETKFFTEKPEEKRSLLKKLYNERVSKVSLRKSVYDCRPMTYFFRYPQAVIDMYAKIGKTVKKNSPDEKFLQFGDHLMPNDEKIGIQMRIPDKSELFKFSPVTFLNTFSPPLGKIARVYSTVKELMKNNGFILSRSQKYNFCWGFSKHRAQIKVEKSFIVVPGIAAKIFALSRMLAIGSKRFPLDQRTEKASKVSTIPRLHASHFLSQERIRRISEK